MELSILNRLSGNCAEPKAPNQRSSGKKRLALFACVFAFVVMSVLGVRAYNSRGPTPRTLDYNVRERVPDTSLTKPAPTKTAQSTGLSSALPGVVITLGPNGFDPETITRPIGPFALILLDRTRLDGISLSFEGGLLASPLRSVVEKRKPERIDTYDLAPGRYFLREENHPGWVFQITITPR
jgi:hypothetical protein